MTAYILMEVQGIMLGAVLKLAGMAALLHASCLQMKYVLRLLRITFLVTFLRNVKK